MFSGAKLKLLRVMRDMTRYDLAREINISVPTVSNWERNVSEPKYSDLEKLMELFNVSFEYFRK